MNYERLEHCPLCNGDSFHNHLIAVDHFLTKESFAIVECDSCSFKFTNPRPSKSDIDRFYKSDEYVSHSNKTSGILDMGYKFVRKLAVKRKLDLLERHIGSAPRTLLDYGCGTGYFLSASINRGWNSIGVEPNEAAASIAAGKGLVIHPSLQDIQEPREFGMITLWHVLEHVHDLNETLEELKALLSAKGNLIIAVPNCLSHDAETFGEFWAGYDVPRHLYHFEPATIQTLLENHGLTLKYTYPMKFDAFYISLLSNKYRFSSYRPLDSLIIGIKSNRIASHSNQYSSQIYVASA